MVRVGRELREEMISEGKLGNRYCRWSLPASHPCSGCFHPGDLSRGLTGQFLPSNPLTSRASAESNGPGGRNRDVDA